MVIVIRESHEGFSVRLESGGVDQDEFRAVITRLKAAIPHAERRYDPGAKSWYISRRALRGLSEWANTCTASFSAHVQWLNDAGENSQAYSLLHLLPTAPPELIKAAYKCLAQLHHPDKGGSTQKMQAINEAYTSLTR
jgi:hypothetical protein